MTVPPPGWYPDPSGGQHGTRWWDGEQWTQHVDGPTVQTERQRLPDDVPTDTVFVWVLALLPLLALPVTLFSHPQVRYVVIDPGGARTVDPDSISTPVSFVLQGLSFAVYVAGIVLALLDHRALVRREVVRPFSWWWALVSPIVYLIGRFVIVRKVAPGRPMWPSWVGAAIAAAGIAVGVGQVVTAVQQVMP